MGWTLENMEIVVVGDFALGGLCHKLMQKIAPRCLFNF